MNYENKFPRKVFFLLWNLKKEMERIFFYLINWFIFYVWVHRLGWTRQLENNKILFYLVFSYFFIIKCKIKSCSLSSIRFDENLIISRWWKCGHWIILLLCALLPTLSGIKRHDVMVWLSEVSSSYLSIFHKSRFSKFLIPVVTFYYPVHFMKNKLNSFQ